MKEVAIAFLGGGLGTVLRYWLSGAVYRYVNSTFPVGILLVNVTGCLLIGFLMSVFEDRFTVQPLLRIFLTLGMLGGFTTFSTFSYETVSLFRDGSYLIGFLNVLYSITGCLVATWLGIMLGKLF